MKLNANYVIRQIGADYFAVAVSASENQQQMIKLNATAAFLFETCREEFTEKSLTEALLAEYDVSREQAEKDVSNFLTAMKKNGLVK